jgi:hypothetical protein
MATAARNVRQRASVEESRLTRLGRLSASERAALAVSNVVFFAVAGALALYMPSGRSPSALALVLLVVAYAAAFEFDFEVRSGSAVPTQLVLVPMLFVLPTGTVPLAVAGAIMLACGFDAARGPLEPGRVFLRLTNAWHAVGPAVVLGLAGEPIPRLSDWPLYLLAFAAQIAISFFVLAVRERVVLGVRPIAQLKAMQSAYVVDIGLAALGLAITLAAAQSSRALVVALPLVAVLVVLVRERNGRLDDELELRDAYRRAATLFGDGRPGARAEGERADVVRLTLAVVDELGLARRERRNAEFAALLNAVAKARIPSRITKKPGPLTQEEWAVVRTHTLEGERILLRAGGLLGTVGRIVRSCHERYDGTGYPDGLAGEEIPLVARIVACCDAFSAMTSRRAYRKALSVDAALEELRRNRGTQFDPRVADALIAIVERG